MSDECSDVEMFFGPPFSGANRASYDFEEVLQCTSSNVISRSIYDGLGDASGRICIARCGDQFAKASRNNWMSIADLSSAILRSASKGLQQILLVRIHPCLIPVCHDCSDMNYV
jgi:hypothetical protein